MFKKAGLGSSGIGGASPTHAGNHAERTATRKPSAFQQLSSRVSHVLAHRLGKAKVPESASPVDASLDPRAAAEAAVKKDTSGVRWNLATAGGDTLRMQRKLLLKYVEARDEPPAVREAKIDLLIEQMKDRCRPRFLDNWLVPSAAIRRAIELQDAPVLKRLLACDARTIGLRDSLKDNGTIEMALDAGRSDMAAELMVHPRTTFTADTVLACVRTDNLDLLNELPDRMDSTVNQAFQDAARQLYPDHNPGDEAAADLKKLFAAYAALPRPRTRPELRSFA